MPSRYMQLRERADREYDQAVRSAGEAYISAIEQARKKHLADRVEADELLEPLQSSKGSV